MRRNTTPTLLPSEKKYYLKERDRAILRRKGRGRKTRYVLQLYLDEYTRIFGETDIFKNIAN